MKDPLRNLTRNLAGFGATLAAGTAWASGPSGTDAVSELTLTVPQMLMLFGGAAVLGCTLWLVIRVLNK